MIAQDLVPHPAAGPAAPPFRLWVNVNRSAAFGREATLDLTYCIGAPLARFLVADSDAPSRGDELWRTTCFEAFVQLEGESGYREYNFAPSGDWAAYDFTAPREGMREPELAAAPYVRREDNLTWWTLGATIAVPADRALRLGLTAVIEETDGTKSYWALAHGGASPDFHDPACFRVALPE
ncbi:DOMON-like domain-containing protein [Sphingomonas sp. ASV193]|uniref:DOMON-like domain-containing protein n=1 Tax=Sphingomonas sp. ASV193 TaxID=3144405 RepID=UPI0032E89A3A